MAEEKERLRTILIVDDTADNASLLEAILCTEYIIKIASRGSEALEIARATPPDLILLDIMMPEINGYDVCKALKADAATEKIPVIFVTALLNPGDETRGFEAGGVDYITKPVVGAIVRVRVKAHIALRESQEELENWNSNLKKRLLQSIGNIRKKTVALMSAEERASGLHGYVQSVELLTGVFELMEDRFGIRSRAVSELAGDAARQMKLPAEEVAKIRLAGLLHDVGTLGINRVLAEKYETEMSAKEREEFHTHPVRGQELFRSLEDLHDVGLMVRSHHEAYNGSGFPDGLKGDDIPLGARLVGIAAFIEQAASSVSSERDVYAIMRMNMNSGTLLDPRLITYFKMITHLLYFEKEKSVTFGEVEVTSHDLISGMQLSRDLFNAAGVLLFQKGDKLVASGIALIRRDRWKKQATNNGVWIYVRNED